MDWFEADIIINTYKFLFGKKDFSLISEKLDCPSRCLVKMFVDFFGNGWFFIKFYFPWGWASDILICQSVDQMYFATLNDKLRFLLISTYDFESECIKRFLNFFGFNLIFYLNICRRILSFHWLIGSFDTYTFGSVFAFETKLCIEWNVNMFHQMIDQLKRQK